MKMDKRLLCLILYIPVIAINQNYQPQDPESTIFWKITLALHQYTKKICEYLIQGNPTPQGAPTPKKKVHLLAESQKTKEQYLTMCDVCSMLHTIFCVHVLPQILKLCGKAILLYVEVSICSGSSFMSTSNLDWTWNNQMVKLGIRKGPLA